MKSSILTFLVIFLFSCLVFYVSIKLFSPIPPSTPDIPEVSTFTDLKELLAMKLFYNLPEWFQEIIRCRLATPVEGDLGYYQVMFADYNASVLIVMACCYTIMFGIITVSLLTVLRNNKDTLLKSYPKTIGKLANSIIIKKLIIANILDISVSFIILVVHVEYLYNNYLPPEVALSLDYITAITS